MTLQDLAEIKALDLAKSIYVVVLEKRDGSLTIARDPAMDRPWSTRNKQLADDTAKQFERLSQFRKAGAMTLEEAFAVLQKDFAKNFNNKHPHHKN